MRKIRTLIIDDEPLARRRIAKLLEQIEYVALIGECKNGGEAVNQIRRYKPDLVFLDVQMPDLSGFEVLAKSEEGRMPFIIFVTAFNQYALKAFDVRAVDYLLKPFDDERFFQALEHARQQILLNDQQSLHQKMVQLIEEFQHQQSDDLTAIEIRKNGQSHWIKLQDVYWIESYGNYLKLHLEHRYYLYRETLASIEAQLPSGQFCRIHRSILINTHFLDKIHYQGNNQFSLTLSNGEQLMSSRGYRRHVEALQESIK
ncbi:MAG: LytTR family DNA-binding domain-containing protein [Bacteroidota bacterium]